ncbi:hypothetical protein [Archaeoglobus veneficus]|uniref:Uncharacterized protein n=1 Tax=Archaeoglobus veneficus (strain DSM 11195 / SNP6) TaxID=693661 RepID=F2KPF3_ARCVS|nr:hypothetical protein [Archaeoglobus veneficus]AEA46384.1 hypothetical protein Arcve_0351 [Archaeoglobus veneficus SNP6]
MFDETTHAAYRLSCYHCHNDSYDYANAIWNKPKNDWDTPAFHGDFIVEWKHYNEIYGLDNNILSKPLFLNAETCIACKRGICYDCHIYGNQPSRSQDFTVYTEPNSTMYRDSTEI